MGLRSIWRHEKDIAPPTTRQRLNRDAISALYWIILMAVIGIIVLSLWGAALRYGVLGNGTPPEGSTADEALSILGNIASAAVGGLVGWLTRDLTAEKPIRDTVDDNGEGEADDNAADE